MEELRSAEILDREIQDDARRKAEKVLKTAEAECRRILDETGSRLDAVKKEKEKEYGDALDAYRRDVESSVPLEKERRLVSFIDASVQKALDAWFDGISASRRLSLYIDRLSKAREVFGDSSVSLTVAGFDEVGIRAAAGTVFGNERISSVAVIDANAALSRGFTDGIIAESADGGITCRATKEEIRSMLLSEQRQELAEALLGGRLSE